jgi:hypothetical protein
MDMDVCGAISFRNKNHPMEQKISEHRALDTQGPKEPQPPRKESPQFSKIHQTPLPL